MPGVLHEVLRELFAKRPDLLTPLLRRQLPLPGPRLFAVDSELTDPRLKQLLPDAVLACPSVDQPSLVLVVEIQLAIDDSKRRVWPQYSATAHGRFACPVVLVVVAPTARVEHWASRPIAVGPGHVMRPLVLGPNALPLLSRAEVRESPVLGMLSTLAHLEDPRSAGQALETLEALSTWDDDPDGRLADILQAALPVAIVARMEELMRTSKYEYQSDFAKKYFAQGLQEGEARGQVAGEARALLLFLRTRGLEVPAVAQAQIEEERDATRLETWIRRAATAQSLDDVFGDD